jgi:hypothetical protein
LSLSSLVGIGFESWVKNGVWTWNGVIAAQRLRGTNAVTPSWAGERRQWLRRKAEELGLLSDRNIWVRKPENERP